jgi:hypothetical protein
MKITVLTLSLVSLGYVGYAQGITSSQKQPQVKGLPDGVTPRAALQQDQEFIIPALIIGGEWTSTIKLANWLNTAIPPTFIFCNDSRSSRPMLSRVFPASFSGFQSWVTTLVSLLVRLG